MNIELITSTFSLLNGIFQDRGKKGFLTSVTFFETYINPIFFNMQVIHKDYLSFFQSIVNALDTDTCDDDFIKHLDNLRNEYEFLRTYIHSSVSALHDYIYGRHKCPDFVENCLEFLVEVNLYFYILFDESDQYVEDYGVGWRQMLMHSTISSMRQYLIEYGKMPNANPKRSAEFRLRIREILTKTLPGCWEYICDEYSKIKCTCLKKL